MDTDEFEKLSKELEPKNANGKTMGSRSDIHQIEIELKDLDKVMDKCVKVEIDNIDSVVESYKRNSLYSDYDSLENRVKLMLNHLRYQLRSLSGDKYDIIQDRVIQLRRVLREIEVRKNALSRDRSAWSALFRVIKYVTVIGLLVYWLG